MDPIQSPPSSSSFSLALSAEEKNVINVGHESIRYSADHSLSESVFLWAEKVLRLVPNIKTKAKEQYRAKTLNYIDRNLPQATGTPDDKTQFLTDLLNRIEPKWRSDILRIIVALHSCDEKVTYCDMMCSVQWLEKMKHPDMLTDEELLVFKENNFFLEESRPIQRADILNDYHRCDESGFSLTKPEVRKGYLELLSMRNIRFADTTSIAMLMIRIRSTKFDISGLVKVLKQEGYFADETISSKDWIKFVKQLLDIRSSTNFEGFPGIFICFPSHPHRNRLLKMVERLHQTLVTTFTNNDYSYSARNHNEFAALLLVQHVLDLDEANFEKWIDHNSMDSNVLFPNDSLAVMRKMPEFEAWVPEEASNIDLDSALIILNELFRFPRVDSPPTVNMLILEQLDPSEAIPVFRRFNATDRKRFLLNVHALWVSNPTGATVSLYRFFEFWQLIEKNEVSHEKLPDDLSKSDSYTFISKLTSFGYSMLKEAACSPYFKNRFPDGIFWNHLLHSKNGIAELVEKSTLDVSLKLRILEFLFHYEIQNIDIKSILKVLELLSDEEQFLYARIMYSLEESDVQTLIKFLVTEDGEHLSRDQALGQLLSIVQSGTLTEEKEEFPKSVLNSLHKVIAIFDVFEESTSEDGQMKTTKLNDMSEGQRSILSLVINVGLFATSY